jgi:hypothetical protein
MLLASAALACGADPATPRGAAERFLDTFYVAIDLPGTLPLTTGAARRKVAEEIRLTLGEGQVIDESTRPPRISYRLLEERPLDARATRFLYRATVRVEDAETFERRWLVTMRHEDGAWRVADYEQLGD